MKKIWFSHKPVNPKLITGPAFRLASRRDAHYCWWIAKEWWPVYDRLCLAIYIRGERDSPNVRLLHYFQQISSIYNMWPWYVLLSVWYVNDCDGIGSRRSRLKYNLRDIKDVDTFPTHVLLVVEIVEALWQLYSSLCAWFILSYLLDDMSVMCMHVTHSLSFPGSVWAWKSKEWWIRSMRILPRVVATFLKVSTVFLGW